MNNIRRNSITKNIVSGALLLGGLAAGLLGANIIAHATQVESRNYKNQDANSNDFSNILIPISEIKNEDMLINLVVEQGTQVLVDDQTGLMYIAYVNETQEIEIAEISEDELANLLQQVNLILEEEGVALYTNQDDYVQDYEYNKNNEEGGYIPQEYWRGSQENKVEKTDRIRLDSKEGMEAIEKARAYKRNNIK